MCNEDGDITSQSEIVQLKHNGAASFVIKAGDEILTDEEKLSVNENDYICVSVYVKEGKIESGNALVNARVLYEKGDCTHKLSISKKERTRNKVLKAVTGVIGLKQPYPIPLIESVELLNNENAKAIVLFGDSVTQQGMWSTPFEEKIRNSFPGKFSVVNKSITGNRVLKNASKSALLKNFYGISAKNRLQRDILRYDNIGFVIMCVGINDILQPGTVDARKSEICTADELFDGVTDIAERIKEKNIKLIIGNYIPFGSATAGKPKAKEQLRKETNKKLATMKNIDGFLDWSNAFGDGNNPKCPKPEYIGKDKMHPSKLGGKALSDTISLELLK